VDNQLVGSDGVRYYVYLPSLLFDGDLNFTNEYIYFYAYDPEKMKEILNKTTQQGLPANQFSIGPAILWAPFFLLAHLIAHIFNLFGANIPTDGYGYFYQGIVIFSNILYGGAGLLLTYRFVQNLTSKEAALIATVLVVFGGNLIYYMTAEPSMSHSLSAFASALFFFTWFKRRNKPGVKTAMLYGLIGGLMALIRPQDGLFLALPFLAGLPAVWRSLQKQDTTKAWRHWLCDAFIAAAVALLIFSPQMIIWGKLYGNYFKSTYMYQNFDILFYWFSPRIGKVLFSNYRGLFTWHPVFLLALLGLLFNYRRDRTFAILGFIGFTIQCYLVSSWHCWYQGDAFGGRIFIVCTPIFVLGLAFLIEWIINHWNWSIVYAVGAMLLILNFLLFVKYRLDTSITQHPLTCYYQAIFY
jgi:hypothetical protein